MKIRFVIYPLTIILTLFALGVINVLISILVGDMSIVPDIIKYIFFIALRGDLSLIFGAALLFNSGLLMFIFKNIKMTGLKVVNVIFILINLFALFALFLNYTFYHSLDNFQL